MKGSHRVSQTNGKRRGERERAEKDCGIGMGRTVFETAVSLSIRGLCLHPHRPGPSQLGTLLYPFASSHRRQKAVLFHSKLPYLGTVLRKVRNERVITNDNKEMNSY